ncbi:MAG: VWA domain-containing protein [Blastocatellia bacterium]|nr:VWA domain-containing protein [Blastocatellia bacterium]
MKRILGLLLFISFFAAFAVSVSAQSRARRVGDSPAPPAPTGSSAPTSPRPPVLGGANGTANSQQPGRTATANGPEEVEAGDVIKVNTTLVTLPVSVMDRDGRYIPNLRKEDFRLWENGVEQQVAFFSSVDKPFSVVLMIDTSGSTRFRLEDIQDAAIAFTNQLRTDDRVMIVSFDDQVRVLSEFTSDRGRLRDAIRRTRPGNGTKLYDAVDMVMNQQLNNVSGRKAIVLFTDGVDTTSRHASYASNVRDAEELDALIYPVQYDTYKDMSGGNGGGGWPGSGRVPTSPVGVLIQILGGISGGRGPISTGSGGPGTSRHEYEVANRYLHELAEKTGARGYQADSSQNLSYAFGNVAEELRRQYSLGYYPQRPAQAGERRQVKVRVNQPNLAVRTRDSYVFNPSGSVQDTAQKTAPVLQRKFAEGNLNHATNR